MASQSRGQACPGVPGMGGQSAWGLWRSGKDEGPALRADEDQKVSSRLARAWPRDTRTHAPSSNHDDNGRPVCVALDHPRPPARVEKGEKKLNCQMGSHTLLLPLRFPGGLMSLPCRNMSHTFLMLHAEIDGRENFGRRHRHISRHVEPYFFTLPSDLTAVTSHSWAARNHITP